MAGTRSLPPRASHGSEPRFEIGGEAAAVSPFTSSVPGVRAAREDGRSATPLAAPFWALPVSPDLPPHPRLDHLMRLPVPSVAMPVARMAAHGADWIVCGDPGGVAIDMAGVAPLGEVALVAQVLRPAASALGQLKALGLTHRALRSSNIFLRGERGGVELGPFWLAPPAHGQSAIFETPWVAACLPEARGYGSIADDVYALGVVLLGLCLGSTPLDGMPEEEVIDRKIRLGSFAALTGDRRLPPSVADLLSAMLADEPSQRPSPERLAQGASLAGPKVVSRRRVNAAVPLVLGDVSVWTTPQLAGLVATAPDMVRRALNLGQVNHWLRRCLNEVVLAEKLEALIHPTHETSPLDGEDPVRVAATLLGVSVLLDPTAPLVWRGIRAMPEGLGTLLASLNGRSAAARADIVAMIGHGLPVLIGMIEDESARERFRVRARQLRSAVRSPLLMLHAVYELNPALACRSPLVAASAPVALQDLLPALDDEAGTRPGDSDQAPFRLDADLIAFIAARRHPSRSPGSTTSSALEEMRLLATIWQETRPGPLPGLAKRLASGELMALASWPGKAQRDLRAARLKRVVDAGDLVRLLEFVEDPEGRRLDETRRDEAHDRIRALVASRDALRDGDMRRRSAAARFGRDGVAVVGAGLSAAMLLAQVLL